MNFKRSSGILLHITSLPGKYGIGELGNEAYRFIDTLVEAGQSLWQILPIGPTGNSYSPYQLYSSFAGNSALISLELLVKEGYLESDLITSRTSQLTKQPDFTDIKKWKTELLEMACQNFFDKSIESDLNDYKLFCERNRLWLQDYALFTILKRIHQNMTWIEWDLKYINRDPNALLDIQKTYNDQIENIQLVQYFFHKQWKKLLNYAHKNKIQIIGDIPIYVAHDSADVWANQSLFYLNKDGTMNRQSGAPPCIFSKTGQLWGNPIYRWGVHKKTGYKWWISQIKKLFTMVDIIRIDHFNGFVKYWEVPADESTAENGVWIDGPGENFFKELSTNLGSMPIIAEDLGEASEDAKPIREKFEFPGLKILQFSFTNNNESPNNFPENSVVYTGTHDNDTTIGWFNTTSGNAVQTKKEVKAERKSAQTFLKSDGKNIHWDMINLALKVKSKMAIIPLQDILGLGSEARMNIPGKPNGNWTWRFSWDMLTPEMIRKMKTLTKKHKR